jgi:hypothetical protein
VRKESSAIVPHFNYESLQAPWIFQALGPGVFGQISKFLASGHKSRCCSQLNYRGR